MKNKYTLQDENMRQTEMTLIATLPKLTVKSKFVHALFVEVRFNHYLQMTQHLLLRCAP